MNFAQKKVFAVLDAIKNELEFMPQGASEITIPYDELLQVVEIPFDKLQKILEKFRLENRIKSYELDGANRLCLIEIDPSINFADQLRDYVLSVETFSVTGGKNLPSMTGKEIQAFIDDLINNPKKLETIKREVEIRRREYVSKLYSEPNYHDDAEWSSWRRRWEMLQAIWSAYISSGRQDNVFVSYNAVLIRNRALPEVKAVFETLINEKCLLSVDYLSEGLSLKHVNGTHLKEAYSRTQELYKKFAEQRDANSKYFKAMSSDSKAEFRITLGSVSSMHDHKFNRQHYLMQCLCSHDRERYKTVNEIIAWWEKQPTFPPLDSMPTKKRQYIINGLNLLKRKGFEGLKDVIEQIADGRVETYRIRVSAAISFNKS